MITLVMKNGKQIASERPQDIYEFYMREMQKRKPGKKKT